MRWILKETDIPEDLPGPRALPRLVRRLLKARGIQGEEDARRYLHPRVEDLLDPRPLPDLETAIERLDAAIDTGEKIFVFGDYDLDGIASSALLTRCLRSFGAQVRVRVPERFSDGYGLSPAILEEARLFGAALMVTADCGTNSIEEIRSARSLGIDVIIADHHQPGPELPDATAVVNPWREDSIYPFRDLCASGVVTKILLGLSERRARRGARTADPLQLLDLTSLGTLADAVTLQAENRIFVRQGLRILRAGPRPALRVLLESAEVTPSWVTSGDLAYQVVPRLNAAGRLGEAALSLELLLCDDAERCYDLAALLDRANEQRKKLLEVAVREAGELAEQDGSAEQGRPLVLHSERWHAGVVGIAASRLAERFGVPVVLLASDGTIARGSGRCPDGMDLLGLVRQAAGTLRSYGGHRVAVGMTLASADLPRFREALLGAAGDGTALTKPRELTLNVDVRASLGDVDSAFLGWIDRFEPFGSGNQEPVLAFRGRLSGELRVLKDRHLRFDLIERGVRRPCIGFNLSSRFGRALAAHRGEVNIAAVPTRNIYRGEERIQLSVRDIAIHDPFGIG